MLAMGRFSVLVMMLTEIQISPHKKLWVEGKHPNNYSLHQTLPISARRLHTIARLWSTKACLWSSFLGPGRDEGSTQNSQQQLTYTCEIQILSSVFPPGRKILNISLFASRIRRAASSVKWLYRRLGSDIITSNMATLVVELVEVIIYGNYQFLGLNNLERMYLR